MADHKSDLQTYIDRITLEHPIAWVGEHQAIGVIVPSGSSLETVDLQKYQPQPARAKGIEVFQEIDSFLEYVLAISPLDATMVSISTTDVIAIFNPHTAIGSPGWGDFGARCKFIETPQAAVWKKQNGQRMTQRECIEHLEDNREEITSPPLAELVDALRGLKIKGSAARSANTGNYSESEASEKSMEIVASNGELPERISLALPLFRGGSTFEIDCRLRIHTGDTIGVSYKMINLERAIEKQLDIWREHVATATGRFVYR